MSNRVLAYLSFLQLLLFLLLYGAILLGWERALAFTAPHAIASFLLSLGLMLGVVMRKDKERWPYGILLCGFIGVTPLAVLLLLVSVWF